MLLRLLQKWMALEPRKKSGLFVPAWRAVGHGESCSANKCLGLWDCTKEPDVPALKIFI